MDSPLLPTHRSKPSSSGHEASLLADLSMDDYQGDDDSFMPASPIRAIHTTQPSSGSSSRTFLPPHTQSAREASPQDVQDGHNSGRHGGPKATGSKPRFSLFAPPRPPSAEIPEHGEDERHVEDDDEAQEGDLDGGEEGNGEDQTIHAGSSAARSGPSAAERDDKLRESLYELRRMNEVFDGFLGALEAARGHNERLAIRVKQTSGLLDQYTELLGQAEHTQALLSNPNWTGAHDDAAAIESERSARHNADEARRLEAERVAEATRLAAEERKRHIADAERARETGKVGGAARGRGVPRGLPRGRGTSSGIPVSTGTRPTGAKTPTTGTRKASGSGGAPPGAGRGGYAHVQSSGYGPSGRK